ncbi:MAG: thioredoxin [Archaeoglobaceae archaeon]|nr:thioredoxin [Archaeoglobaceae archaeon]
MDELENIRMKKIKELTDKLSEKKSDTTHKLDFDEILKKYENVVVDFWAPWCPSCRMLLPVIDELAKEYEKKVVFVKVNTDQNPKIATRFSIFAVPTLIFFKNSKPVDRIVGTLPKSEIKKWIEKNIK